MINVLQQGIMCMFFAVIVFVIFVVVFVALSIISAIANAKGL